MPAWQRKLEAERVPVTENQFFSELAAALRGLPAEERDDILQDFREHFEVGRAEGRSDEEIARSLGAPRQIARELLAAHHLERAETRITAGNILRAVWAVIGLSFFNLVVVLGPFLGLVGFLLGLWVTGVSLVVSPLLVVANAALGRLPAAELLLDLFISLTLSGIGILIVIGLVYVTRAFAKLFVSYLRFNAQLVMGGVSHAAR